MIKPVAAGLNLKYDCGKLAISGEADNAGWKPEQSA